MSLASPTKADKLPSLNLIDDERKAESPKSLIEDEEEDEFDEYRNQWVGEVDLPESTCSRLVVAHGQAHRMYRHGAALDGV